MTAEAMDTTNIDIREEDIPDGYVSTRDVIAAFREVGTRNHWCGTERNYLVQNTDIRFGTQTWDENLRDYVPKDFDPWAVTKETPTTISKVDLIKTLRDGMRGHPYEARKGVNALAEKLDLDFKIFNDSFEITVRVDTYALLVEEDELNLDDDSIEDTDTFARALRSAAYKTLYNRGGYVSLQDNEYIESGVLRVKRIPDPARSQ